MAEPESTYFETRLQRAIEEIEGRIRDLTQEKAALQRQLMKVRRENADLRDVNRKNSVNRVMIESKVMETLRAAEKPLSARDLFRAALNVNFELKDNTFRTILHRMKLKKMIENSSAAGWWRIPRVTQQTLP